MLHYLHFSAILPLWLFPTKGFVIIEACIENPVRWHWICVIALFSCFHYDISTFQQAIYLDLKGANRNQIKSCLVNFLFVCFSLWLTDSLTDWLIYWLADSITDLLIDSFTELMNYWLADSVTDWPIYWLSCQHSKRDSENNRMYQRPEQVEHMYESEGAGAGGAPSQDQTIIRNKVQMLQQGKNINIFWIHNKYFLRIWVFVHIHSILYKFRLSHFSINLSIWLSVCLSINQSFFSLWCMPVSLFFSIFLFVFVFLYIIHFQFTRHGD